jgi:hypothetical protein
MDNNESRAKNVSELQESDFEIARVQISNREEQWASKEEGASTCLHFTAENLDFLSPEDIANIKL